MPSEDPPAKQLAPGNLEAFCTPDDQCMKSAPQVLAAICKLFLDRDVLTSANVPAHMRVAALGIEVAVDSCELWISPGACFQAPSVLHPVQCTAA